LGDGERITYCALCDGAPPDVQKLHHAQAPVEEPVIKIFVPMNWDFIVNRQPWTWFDTLLARFFKYQEIRSGCENKGSGPVYMRRFFIRRQKPGTHDSEFGSQIYIHHILRDDADDELHDHPWSFWSFIFKGGYWEETEEPEFQTLDGQPYELDWQNPKAGRVQFVRRRKWYGAPRFLFRNEKARHRLVVPRPSWTLVVTGRKKKSWSFFGRDGKSTPWRDFLKAKCD
jgi:hypothetical protein